MNKPFHSYLVYEDGYPELIDACSAEDYDAVLDLIQRGADVNVADKFGENPLGRAARYGYKGEETAARIVALLLDNGADINAQGMGGETALMQAAFYNYGTIARMLIQRGADVNLRSSDGNTVLARIEEAPVLKRNRKRIMKMIEEAGGVR